MNNIRIVSLDKSNAAPFATYLLPAVREEIAAGRNMIAVGAADDSHAYGAAAAQIRNGEMRLISVYVDKSVRRKGIGTALVEGLAQLVLEQDDSVMGAVADYMIEDEDQKGIEKFLKRMGFSEPQESHRLFAVDTARLHKMPYIGAAFSVHFQDDPHIRTFAEITDEQMKEIAEDSSVPAPLKPDNSFHHIWKRAATIWVEDGHVMGWLLCYQGFDGGIVLSAACKRAGAPKGCFHKLLLSSANRCFVMLGHDFTCYISTINEHAGSLVEKIAAGTQKEFAHYRAYTGEEPPYWLQKD